jgi:hypothetical protein
MLMLSVFMLNAVILSVMAPGPNVIKLFTAVTLTPARVKIILKNITFLQRLIIFLQRFSEPIESVCSTIKLLIRSGLD